MQIPFINFSVIIRPCVSSSETKKIHIFFMYFVMIFGIAVKDVFLINHFNFVEKLIKYNCKAKLCNILSLSCWVHGK